MELNLQVQTVLAGGLSEVLAGADQVMRGVDAGGAGAKIGLYDADGVAVLEDAQLLQALVLLQRGGTDRG